ncbi:MAG: DUF4377 domain-containing protein [Nitrosopumilus sp.]
MRHLIFFGVLILSGILVSYDPIFASHEGTHHEETQHSTGHKKTIFVGPELSDCVGMGPQKCMMTRDSHEADWQYFYDDIEGFIHEAGYDYHIEVLITDVASPPADASSKKYELLKILSKSPSSMHHDITNEVHHHLSHKGMCAPGFAPLGGMCVLDDKCGPGAYPGRVCIMDGVMKPYLKPLHQKHAGISVENIICAEGKHLMFKHHDATPACVNSHSVDKLKYRGWQTEIPHLPCTLEYMPVCGMDGVSYGNMCALNANHMEMRHMGGCTGITETSETVSVCGLEPDPGMCKAYMPRYYFDKTSSACQGFVWGGCGGTVPFESLSECQMECEN